MSVTVNQGVDAGIAGPLAGVTVTALTTSGGPITADAGGLVTTAVTDASGTASLTLPLGVSALTFTLTGYTSPAPVLVGVVALQAVAISVTMSPASSSAPTLVLAPAAAYDVGFGATVPVTATATSPLGNAITYTWANSGMYGLGSVSGTAGTGSVTTPTLLEAMASQPDPSSDGGWNLGNFVSGYKIPSTFGKLPIMDDTNGGVTATVTATDSFGLSTTASIKVTAASYQDTTASAVIGTRVFMNAGGPVDAGASWSLTGPAGSTSSFDDTSSQFPSFVPDVPGPYVATLGSNSLKIYAGTWRGVVQTGASTQTPNPWNGNAPVPFEPDQTCMLCHGQADAGRGYLGIAPDQFTPWIGTKHAVHMTYAMNGVPGFGSGQACLQCHSVGYDPGNTNALAGGLSMVAADAGWTYPATIDPSNWDAVPPSVAQLCNIQCENCHGPQGGAGPGFPSTMTLAHTLTQVSNVSQPFQSPRISYAAEVCGTCHASGTTHHEYSEWATGDATHLSADYAGGETHANLAAAIEEGLTTFDAGPALGVVPSLNKSCARCHTAQGYTVYLDNLAVGNVGSLGIDQQGIGQVTENNIQPQTCVACHDPHRNAVDPVTGDNEHQLRVWNDTGLLPGGFAGAGMGAGAVCLTCHNSRNGAYNLDANNATTTAYLHEDSDPIGANPALSSLAYSGLGTGFKSMGGPHEANQGDVFEGHNAYFLTNQTPIVSPHSAVKNTCVGCHMTNQPQTYSNHGTVEHASHLFAITDPAVPTLCASCHSTGTSNVDGASLQASVQAGLQTILTNMGTTIVARLNDATGQYVAPPATASDNYGTWVDTGTINIAANGLTDTTPDCTPATDPSCGLENAGAVTIVTSTGNNPVVSAVAAPQGRAGITAVLTFTTPVSITFAGGVVNTLSSFTVDLGTVQDALANPMFAQNGNMYKANWNYSLIAQDQSLGVHNPPFVSAVLAATASPFGNPNASPPQPGGLWY